MSNGRPKKIEGSTPSFARTFGTTSTNCETAIRSAISFNAFSSSTPDSIWSFAISIKKLWFKTLEINPSCAVSKDERSYILYTFARSQHIISPNFFAERPWRSTSSLISWPIFLCVSEVIMVQSYFNKIKKKKKNVSFEDTSSFYTN